MFVVIAPFFDLQDGNRYYKEGETFPRNGLAVSEERVSELSGKKNRLGKPIIKEMPEEKQKRKTATKSRKGEG